MNLKEYMGQFDSCVRIGKGGQKTVYRAEKGGKSYALKIVQVPDNPRIKQEITILSTLDITGVPKVFDHGTVIDDVSNDTVLYILEEYIDGESLRTILSREKIIETGLAINILNTLLAIEIQLEEQAILHRDIKPDNIIVGSSGDIYLIDFGIAKILGESSLTRTADANGPCTPAYAPWELAANLKRQQDVRTDLYQIGVTIYESLAGGNPFAAGARNRQEMMIRGRTIIPASLHIKGDSQGQLMQYISMLMAKNPSQRPKSASDAKRYFDAIRSSIN